MAKIKETEKDIEIEYCQQIRDFVNSDAWKKYALPLINQVVTKELPKPVGPDWEDKYRYAFALSDAFSMIINTLQNLSGRDEFLKKMGEALEGGKKDAPIDEA